MASEKEIKNKSVIMYSNDGAKLSPIVHANSIKVSDDARPLGEILDDNKESIEQAQKKINSNIIKINQLSDLHDDLLYYDDDGEEDKITNLAIIIKPDILSADVNNADLILKEIRNTIRRMDEKSVAHIKSEDPNDYIKLNTTQQEIENLRAEMAAMHQSIKLINNVLNPENFATTRYGDAISKIVREVEIEPIYEILKSIEERLLKMDERIREVERKEIEIEKIIGTTQASDLPGYEEGEDISILKLLWALYSTSHNFIDLDNETSETKNEDESGE